MYEEIKTACLYLRYSSSNQTEQSIEGQMHVCQDFCKRHNIRIVEMYIDRATSASKDIEKRVEFLKMIKDSEKGNFNAVIVYKLDRFARSRYDSATYKYRLKRNGVQLISATENITQDPEGIILESVLEGMAEFYSAELSQKINRGMRESAMKHNSIGGAIPLGYKTVDKKLVIDETTAPIVREAFQMYADGESVAEICRTFNNRGYKTSKGTRFGKSSFTKIFRNEKYIGVYKYHDYRAEDVIPPIIDKDLWDRVQVRVGKIKKAPARNKARHTYLLTGKLFCGHCGSAMNADGNSQGYLYYRCYGKKNLDKQCNKRNMEKNLIERLVAQDAMSFLTDEYIEKIATIACDRNKQEIESDSPIPVIRDRIRQVDVSLNNLLKAIETGSAPDMLVKRMGELETEKKDMEVQLKKEMAHQVYIDKEQVIFWLEKFREGDINDEEFCQTVIDLFVNSVTVWDEPDDKFKITIAYNLTSIPQKTYRLSKDGRLSDYASNTPGLLFPSKVTVISDIIVILIAGGISCCAAIRTIATGSIGIRCCSYRSGISSVFCQCFWKERGNLRNIRNQKQNCYRCCDHWHNGFGNLLNGNFHSFFQFYGNGDKQVDTDWRSYLSDGQVDRCHDTECYQVIAKGFADRKHNRDENIHGRVCIDKASCNQENDIDNQKEYKLVMSNASKKIRCCLRNTKLCADKGEQRSTCDDQHNSTGCFGRIHHQIPQIFQLNLFIDKDSDKQTVYNGNGSCLGRGENTSIDTAKDDDRH